MMPFTGRYYDNVLLFFQFLKNTINSEYRTQPLYNFEIFKKQFDVKLNTTCIIVNTHTNSY